MFLLNHIAKADETRLSRRSFLKCGLASGLVCLSSSHVWSALGSIHMPERSLYLYNPNTREILRTTYWADGVYISEALDEINHIMRDRFNGRTKPIDVRLLDLLHAIGTELKAKKPLHVISGYRSPETNALLRRYGKQVAKNSFHLQGKAVDFRVPGCRVATLRRVSAQFRGGGVGYYPRSRFVHLDVGPVRYWSGR